MEAFLLSIHLESSPMVQILTIPLHMTEPDSESKSANHLLSVLQSSILIALIHTILLSALHSYPTIGKDKFLRIYHFWKVIVLVTYWMILAPDVSYRLLKENSGLVISCLTRGTGLNCKGYVTCGRLNSELVGRTEE